MAAANFTPISLYYSTTAAAAPTTGNLINGELGLNITDGKLYYKDNAGVVQLLATKDFGYRNLPPVGTKTSSYSLATGDVGKYVQVGTGGSITIPNNVFAEGDAITIFNNTSGNITITCTITIAYIAGVDTDRATMTLATRGVATVLFTSPTECVVSGSVT